MCKLSERQREAALHQLETIFGEFYEDTARRYKNTLTEVLLLLLAQPEFAPTLVDKEDLVLNLRNLYVLFDGLDEGE